MTGRPDEAIEQGQLRLTSRSSGGDPHAASLHGSMLSMFLTTYGDSQRAVQRAEQAFALGSELGNPTLLAVSEVALGYALTAVDRQRARVHLEAGMSTSRLVGNDMARSIGERKLAEILAAAGDLIGALETYLAVLEHAMEFGVRLPVALTCRSIAVDLAAAGYHDVAATMFGALESRLSVDQGNPLMWREAAIARLQRATGTTNFDDRAARGGGDGRRSTRSLPSSAAHTHHCRTQWWLIGGGVPESFTHDLGDGYSPEARAPPTCGARHVRPPSSPASPRRNHEAHPATPNPRRPFHPRTDALAPARRATTPARRDPRFPMDTLLGVARDIEVGVIDSPAGVIEGLSTQQRSASPAPVDA